MLYRIYDDSDTLVLELFVRPGEKTDSRVPAGRYCFHEARGTEWYGEEELFGADGYYCVLHDENGNHYRTIEDGYAYDFAINNAGYGENKTITLTDF